MATTLSWSKAVDEADAMVERAFNSDRLADSHHYFLCAASLYAKAEAPRSAEWAKQKAQTILRMLSKGKA